MTSLSDLVNEVPLFLKIFNFALGGLNLLLDPVYLKLIGPVSLAQLDRILIGRHGEAFSLKGSHLPAKAINLKGDRLMHPIEPGKATLSQAADTDHLAPGSRHGRCKTLSFADPGVHKRRSVSTNG